METFLQIPIPKLENDICLTGEELESMGVFPTNLQCFTYYHYVLFQKEDKRIILKPLPHNLYKVVRIYDFISAWLITYTAFYVLPSGRCIIFASIQMWNFFMFLKESRYRRLYDQIIHLLLQTDDLITGMATVNAILYHKIPDFFWVGFYLLKEDRLLVGPYQGPLACQELESGKGVCWRCLNTESTVIVPDVNQFPGHIACDSRSKSEIAIPVISKDGNKIGVLDIDSEKQNCFDETDGKYLNQIIQGMISSVILP